MGLDQNAYARSGVINNAVDFDSEETDFEFAYWRKHANLQGWMEGLYRQKGGTDPDFNCVNLQLTLEDLDALAEATLSHTTGFFFGETTDEDLARDKVFIADARLRISNGESVYYTAWY